MSLGIVTVFPGSSNAFLARIIEQDGRRVKLERTDNGRVGWYWRDQVAPAPGARMPERAS